MTVDLILGLQWGDEGKGKITDLLGQKADYVVRFQGGNNAGHTIIVGEKKIVLHQIPSGILHPSCVSVIAHGVVFEPEAFLEELEKVKKENKQVVVKFFTQGSNPNEQTYYCDSLFIYFYYSVE